LKEEFMLPLNISAYKLAKDIGVSTSRIQDVLADRRKVTADTAIRLAEYFGTGDRFFINIQNDLEIREVKMKLQDELDRIMPCVKIKTFQKSIKSTLC